eukprot:CAMPEP_0197257076 /NCGR_PEP_ID=MMETSP1429-20130617/77583_1 /TAXON_ID=49237 /ORGANISM="Chaetoceros  sp., Strain UNC1202" /LENGTH=50 /DNA_ID=CAMNT_0042720837 /DNA_START=1 /DNA_END=150 /DNA_ORIENTATION=+
MSLVLGTEFLSKILCIGEVTVVSNTNTVRVVGIKRLGLGRTRASCGGVAD